MSSGQKLIVVAGHVCLDVIPTFALRSDGKSPELRPGHLIEVGPAVRSTGGAVSNTGLALHRLGTPVRLIGKIGDDLFGEEMIRLFRAHAPSLADGMVCVPGETTSYSVVINPPGVDRTFLHCPGANNSFSAIDVTDAALKDADLFHFGYPPVMQNMWQDNGRQLASLFQRVHQQGLTTSLDLCMVDPGAPAGRIDWSALFGEVLPFVDFFCPSVDELLFMLERPTYERIEAEGGFSPGRHVTHSLVSRLAERCLEMGAGVVAIKLGDQGLYLRSTSNADRLKDMGRAISDSASAWLNQELYSPCFQANVVGTTGSGDCTIAGLLSALIRQERPEDVVRAAVAVGAASVEAPDAISGVPHWNQLAQRLSHGWATHAPLMEGRGNRG